MVERGGKAEQEVCIAKTWQTWRCRWPSWQERGTGGEAEEGGGVVTTAATAINQSPMFANDIIHFQAPLPTSMLPVVCKKMLGNHDPNKNMLSPISKVDQMIVSNFQC